MLKRRTRKRAARTDGRSIEARRLLVQGLGDARPGIIVKLLTVLFLVSWSADALFHWFLWLRETLGASVPGNALWLYDLSPLLLLVTLVWFLRYKARQSAQSFDVVVNTHQPAPHSDLAILLSPVSSVPEIPSSALPASIDDISLDQAQDFFQWRMPLEALRSQLNGGELRRVWLIGSAGDQGSARQAEAFRALAEHYLGDQLDEVSFPDLSELRDLAEDHAEPALPPNVLDDGVDHSNIAQVARLVDRIRHYCRLRHKADDLVVDVTGMTVTASIGAVIACLGQGQSFLYTSTQDYRVQEYDMAYEANEL